MKRRLFYALLATLPTLAQVSPAIAQTTTAAQQQGQTAAATTDPNAEVGLPGLYYDPDPEGPPSFQELDGAEEPGYVEVPLLPEGAELDYRVDRAWPEGATPDQILKFGDLESNPATASFTQLTLREITERQGVDVAGVPIGDVPLVNNLTVGQVSDLYKTLNNGENITVDAAAPALQAAVGILYDSNNQAGQQLQQAALTTEQRGLVEELSQIPALEGIPLQDLAQGNWESVITQAEQIELAGIGESLGPVLQKLPVDQIVSIISGTIQGDWEQVRQQAQDHLIQAGTEIAVEELIEAVPELENLPLGAIAELQNQPIEQVLPEVVDLAIEEIPDSSSESLNSVPGLSSIPVNDLPIDLAVSFLAGDAFAKFDIAYSGVEGKEEPSVNYPLSGGSEDQRFRPTKCTIESTDEQRADNCPHFEMANTVGSVLEAATETGIPNDVEGKQWTAGDSGGDGGQGVKGGKGILQIVNFGWEPTGIHPFGIPSHTKFLIKNIQEYADQPSTAELHVAFQFCVNILFTEHCTPHFVVIPTGFTLREGGWFLVASNRSLPGWVDALRDQSGVDQNLACNPNQPIATAGQSDTIPTAVSDQEEQGTPTPVDPDHNVSQYLARIALGESSGGTDTGSNSETGATGEFQFIPETRQSILERHGVDAWSPNKAERDQAVIALIEDFSQETGEPIIDYIRSGDFAAADSVLGQHVRDANGNVVRYGQFTSLPGGAEQHSVWTDPAVLEQYGPTGEASTNAPIAVASVGRVPCPPGQVASTPDAGGSFEQGTGESTGELVEPLNGPITSDYGPRTHPVTGEVDSWHSGIDYGIPTGTPVQASDGGVVVDVEKSCIEGDGSCAGGFGNLVRIRHSNGLETVYAHLSDTPVEIGDTVDRGQEIALSGNTGRSTGPHLHFEVREGPGWSRNDVNPNNYLR